MTSKTQIDASKVIPHRPFVIRKTIVLSALALAIMGGVLFGNLGLGIVLYFGFVALFDGISHYIFDLKSSDFSNSEELLKSEKVTGEELDQYFDTRQYIRFVSLGLAFLAFAGTHFFFFYPLEAFCLAYVLSTIAGILYTRFFLKIARPRVIYRDTSYDHPTWLLPRPFGAYADFSLWSTGHNVPLRL